MNRDAEAESSNSKQIKLDEHEKSTEKANLEFVDLIEDAVFATFDYLSAADLCSMQFTCKRFHNLATSHFERNFSDKTITIKQSYRLRKSNRFERKIFEIFHWIHSKFDHQKPFNSQQNTRSHPFHENQLRRQIEIIAIRYL